MTDFQMSEVDLGYRKFQIVMSEQPRNEKDALLYGDISYDKGVIRIEKTLKLDHAVSVLMHEIIHGLLDEYMIDTHGEEERICDGLSAGLLMVFKLNPALLKLLEKVSK